jgi:hypothetical protein
MHPIPKEWLASRISVREAEAANSDGGPPFGVLHGQWERLKRALEAGGELWEFVSPPESWAHRRGRQGYALVRRGEVVQSISTTE